MPEVVESRFRGPAFAILRVIAGLMFAMHGSQKFFGVPPRDPSMKGPLQMPAVVGGGIELVGGILIAVGLFGAVAAFIAAGEMAAAYFMVHFPQGPTPLQNRGELAVLYCFVWLYVAAHGSGMWSLDSLLGRGRPRAVTASTDVGHA